MIGLLLLVLLGSVLCAEKKEFQATYEEDIAFWGRTLLRGASMSASVPPATDTPPTMILPTIIPTDSPPQPTSGCEILYAAASDSSFLFTIDVAAQAQNVLEGFRNFGDIAYDVPSKVIQVTNSSSLPPSFSLRQIDPVSLVIVGSIGPFQGRLSAIQFVGDILYAIYEAAFGEVGTLVIVDTEVGLLTEIGLLGFTRIAGLAYDANAGVLWGVRNENPNDPRDRFTELITIDLETGFGSSVSKLSDSFGTQLWQVSSIEFGPDGSLYGTVSSPPRVAGTPPPYAGYILRIDDTSMGLATPLFGSTYGSITGLTCGPLPGT